MPIWQAWCSAVAVALLGCVLWQCSMIRVAHQQQAQMVARGHQSVGVFPRLQFDPSRIVHHSHIVSLGPDCVPGWCACSPHAQQLLA